MEKKNRIGTPVTSWIAAGIAALALLPAAHAEGPGPAPEGSPAPMPMMHPERGAPGPAGMRHGMAEHPMPGRGAMGGHWHYLQAANLDEAQKDKVFAIMHAQAPAMRQAGKAAHKANEELRQMTRSGKFDEAKAKSLADAGARAMAEMMLLRARSEAQVYALLTDEQRKRIDMMRTHAAAPRGPRPER